MGYDSKYIDEILRNGSEMSIKDAKELRYKVGKPMKSDYIFSGIIMKHKRELYAKVNKKEK
jgi:hypothetical protein